MNVEEVEMLGIWQWWKRVNKVVGRDGERKNLDILKMVKFGQGEKHKRERGKWGHEIPKEVGRIQSGGQDKGLICETEGLEMMEVKSYRVELWEYVLRPFLYLKQ